MADEDSTDRISILKISERGLKIGKRIGHQTRASGQLVGPVILLIGIGILFGLFEQNGDNEDIFATLLEGFFSVLVGTGFTLYGWSERFRR